MNIHAIKIGDHLPTIRRASYDDDNIIIGDNLPSFCGSQYKTVYDLKNPKDEIYILADDHGYITNITSKFSEAVDCEKADKILEWILSNA